MKPKENVPLSAARFARTQSRTMKEAELELRKPPVRVVFRPLATVLNLVLR